MTRDTDIPQQPQAQASLSDQLRSLHFIANRWGYYDAADFIERVLERVPDTDDE